MKLIDLKLDEYLDILISDEPAPGAGTGRRKRQRAGMRTGSGPGIHGMRPDDDEEEICG